MVNVSAGLAIHSTLAWAHGGTRARAMSYGQLEVIESKGIEGACHHGP